MTPETHTELERIAARLGEAQRSFIRSRPQNGGWTSWLPSSERREYRGLVERGGYCSNRLTARGRRLQQYLSEARP